MESISIDVSSYGPEEIAKAEERLRVVEDKIRRDAHEMLEVLKIDIPNFVRREVKRRFVSNPDFAERLADEKLAQLKADAEAAGQTACAEVSGALSDPEAWLPADGGGPESENLELRDSERVWSAIQRVGVHLHQLLRRYDFPGLKDDEFKECYKLPAYFVGGRYMKSLVESYWKNMHECRQLRAHLKEVREKDRKEKLSDRWEKV